jgi:DNA repair protein RecO (recombination protein O)
MSDLSADAIVCSIFAHGEQNAVVRVMTEDHGLLAGYVRGGRSARQRALLMPGNKVKASWRARVDDQLGTFILELVQSRATLALGGRLPAAALSWAAALCASALPERVPYPGIYASYEALLTIVEVAEAFVWAQALARFELTLLAELGFGLDLSQCAATGDLADLAYVSPKSAQAVSRAAGAPYHDRMLPLPPFVLRAAHAADWAEIRDGLKLSGYFLEKQMQDKRGLRCLEARQQLMLLLAELSQSAIGARHG